MFEKVNPSHPDKVADRIAGAMVDLAYEREEMLRVAVEVLIGHGHAYVIAESSVRFTHNDVEPIVERICGEAVTQPVHLLSVPQDKHLAENQAEGLRCGDNGIFRGVPVSDEENELSEFARMLYNDYPTDGKFVIDNGMFDNPIDGGRGGLVVCQSDAPKVDLMLRVMEFARNHYSFAGITLDRIMINPLGPWTGGLDVDSGATNRKLGSDMGRAVTGGGLHGKDLSKADVSVNIVCHLLAREYNTDVWARCAIGDDHVRFVSYGSRCICDMPFADVVTRAGDYIRKQGGFEKFAEWGLI